MTMPADGVQTPGVRTYRPALDGLRALSVGAIVTYHLNPQWLPGGFLGVDVFFVLSGYLITSLLIDEHHRTGAIAFGRFMARRVRRLLPAATLVIIAVAVAWILLAGQVDQIGLRGDALASLLYSANWWFIATDQSYFAAFQIESPYLHFWSLAIEEQFYILWPLIMMLCLLARRWTALAVVTVSGIMVSAGLMALLYVDGGATRAYMGTDARMHELLIGAGLAMLLAGRWRPRIIAISRWAFWPALPLLIAATVLLHDDSPWYYRGGSVLVACAAAAVIAGLESLHWPAKVIGWKPLVAIGIISYGIYLWHWPVIQLMTVRDLPTTTALHAAIAVGITLVLSILMYDVVEKPIRGHRPDGRDRVSTLRVALIAPILILSSGAAVVVLTNPEDVTWAAQDDRTALAELSASRISPTQPLVGLLGDSVTASVQGPLGVAMSDRGYAMRSAAFRGCPIGHEAVVLPDGHTSPFAEHCADVVPPGQDALVADAPEVVVWLDLQSSQPRLADDGAYLEQGSAAWTDDVIASWRPVLDRIIREGSTVIIVLPPERGPWATGACPEGNRRCAAIQTEDAAIRSATREFAASLPLDYPVALIEVDDLLCPDGPPCPSEIDGVIVREQGQDLTHFTPEGAKWFAPRYADRILAASARVAASRQST